MFRSSAWWCKGWLRAFRRVSAQSLSALAEAYEESVEAVKGACAKIKAMIERPRRLRRTKAVRDLVAETVVRPEHLIAPLFVREGIDSPQPIEALPGHFQHTLESSAKEARRLHGLGVKAFLIFGVPERKDATGSAAYDGSGISQLAIRSLREEFGDDAVVMADLCLCGYTDHGHCGVLEDGAVDNDATLELYAQTAVAQAGAWADVVAPSGMMDGQVAAIRSALDEAGYPDVAIMGYAAKFASAHYGPFREAADCAPKEGDRSSYQMDPRNGREAVREVILDVDEGADIVMVKPALPYLDVIAAARASTDLPVAAYNVSGEYAMVKAAAAKGWIDGDRVAMEHVTSIRRAGADLVITYFAGEVAADL